MNTLQPGQSLGPYQIINQIGKGGMATVYKAYHASMDRYVALKVVAAGLTDDPNFLKRFQQEARLIAKLEHPHILPVHDFGEADGIPYMVMRYLEAGTLKERLSSGPLPLEEADRIFTQLANALGYAHENGVIHRDIKPSNAMLDRRGDVFLTDFGVAKMLEGSSELTATGAITGTPAYMSPEQATGNRADQRSDIYSLGILLFEMLTGRVPFEAETPMAVLFKQIQDPPPPLSMVRPDLPYTLEAVLLKAMAKDPADRYQDMQSFLSSWKSALASAPVEEVQPPIHPPAAEINPPPAEPKQTPVPVPPKKPTTSPVRWLAGCGAAVIVLMLIVACLFTARLAWQRFNANRQEANPEPTPPFVVFSAASPAMQDYEATSWAAANIYYSLAIADRQLLAAGPGGVVVYDLDSWESSQQYTTADGIPGGMVNVVHRGQGGALWVGSDNGLLAIRGEERRLFNDENGLDSNYISALTSDRKYLYIGTQYSAVNSGGLLQLDTNSGLKPVPGFPSQVAPDDEHVSSDVNQILLDSGGGLWVATSDGIAMRDTDGNWHVFKESAGLPEKFVYALYEMNDGSILAGMAGGYAAVFNWDTWQFESYNISESGVYDIRAILQGQDGSLWFAGFGLARYFPQEDRWETYQSGDGSFPAYNAVSLAMDDSGGIYIGTEGDGIVYYGGDGFETLPRLDRPRYPYYRQVLESPDGMMLFSSLYSNGADQFDPNAETWSPLPSDYYEPIGYAPDGSLWSGGFDGLWIFHGEKTTHLTTRNGLPSDTIRTVAFGPDNRAYLGTDSGLAILDGATVTTTYTAEQTGWQSEDINALLAASDGSVWVASGTQISHLSASGKWEIFNAPDLFGGYLSAVQDFAEDQQGNIWVATHGDGLYRFSAGTWSRYLSTDPGSQLPGDYLASLAVGPDGALWIGTFGKGLVRFNGSSWQIFGIENGLIHPSILDIYISPQGTLWLATEGGITRLQPK